MKSEIIAQDWKWNPYSQSYRKKAEEIRLRVTIEYAPAYAKASWWGKWMIQFKIGRQVAKELRALHPRYRV